MPEVKNGANIVKIWGCLKIDYLPACHFSRNPGWGDGVPRTETPPKKEDGKILKTLSNVPKSDVLAIVDWASQNPLIRKVWLYGSRIKGNNKPDSDLDVAVEHGKIPGDDTLKTTSIGERKFWQIEIQERTSLKIHLEPYRPGETERIEVTLKDASVLIYDNTAESSG